MISEEIKLSTAKKAKSVHVGSGAWLIIPRHFKKAKTYDGYQGKGYTSSIKVEVSYDGLREIRKKFSNDQLKRYNKDLKQMSPASHVAYDSAFYAVTFDHNVGAKNYLLAIQKGNRTYSISAFCRAEYLKLLGDEIEKSVLSTFLGEIEKPAELPFKLANISKNKMVYTKDGEFPTQSEGSASITVKNMILTDAKMFDKIVLEDLKRMTGIEARKVDQQTLQNGTKYSAAIRTDDIVGYSILVNDDDGDSFLVSCTSLIRSDLRLMKEFVESQIFVIHMVPQ